MFEFFFKYPASVFSKGTFGLAGGGPVWLLILAIIGVGAGLAISRRIARRHGGDVEFLDHRDGACVQLSLPRQG